MFEVLVSLIVAPLIVRILAILFDWWWNNRQ